MILDWSGSIRECLVAHRGHEEWFVRQKAAHRFEVVHRDEEGVETALEECPSFQEACRRGVEMARLGVQARLTSLYQAFLERDLPAVRTKAPLRQPVWESWLECERGRGWQVGGRRSDHVEEDLLLPQEEVARLAQAAQEAYCRLQQALQEEERGQAMPRRLRRWGVVYFGRRGSRRLFVGVGLVGYHQAKRYDLV